jgi:DNA-binding CsgD family transcriptional regulator
VTPQIRVPRLTRRELEVLGCLARGLSVAESAAELWVTADTIKSHRKRIYAFLGVGSNAHTVVVEAERRGLLQVPQ